MGSPFSSYAIPSLALFALVGGACLAGAIAVVFGPRGGAGAAFLAGLVLVGWIAAQVAIIGYVSWMQPAVFAAGAVILVLATILRGVPPARRVHRGTA